MIQSPCTILQEIFRSFEVETVNNFFQVLPYASVFQNCADYVTWKRRMECKIYVKLQEDFKTLRSPCYAPTAYVYVSQQNKIKLKFKNLYKVI